MSTWIDGGSLPLKLASFHRHTEREATQTPDEVVQRQLRGTTQELFESLIRIDPRGGGSITVNGLVINRAPVPGFQWNQHQKDGLILCLATEANQAIGERLRKPYCVEIVNIPALHDSLNSQLGLTALHGHCHYTANYDRSTFLKHDADSWQKEYRFFWETDAERTVYLPGGTALEVHL